MDNLSILVTAARNLAVRHFRVNFDLESAENQQLLIDAVKEQRQKLSKRASHYYLLTATDETTDLIVS